MPIGLTATIIPLYDAKLQRLIDFVWQQYVAQGDDEHVTGKLVGLLELKHHSTTHAAADPGGIKTICDAFVGVQKRLYEPRASIG